MRVMYLVARVVFIFLEHIMYMLNMWMDIIVSFRAGILVEIELLVEVVRGGIVVGSYGLEKLES
jgi:hypothetical protein